MRGDQNILLLQVCHAMAVAGHLERHVECNPHIGSLQAGWAGATVDQPSAWLVLQCHKQLRGRAACEAVVDALQGDSQGYAEGRCHANAASVQPRSVWRGASCRLQFGDMRGFWGVWHAGLSQLRKKTGVISTAEGEGTANTALVYHANKLMSLHEGDLPYAVSLLYHPHVAQSSLSIRASAESMAV